MLHNVLLHLLKEQVLATYGTTQEYCGNEISKRTSTKIPLKCRIKICPYEEHINIMGQKY